MFCLVETRKVYFHYQKMSEYFRRDQYHVMNFNPFLELYLPLGLSLSKKVNGRSIHWNPFKDKEVDVFSPVL